MVTRSFALNVIIGTLQVIIRTINLCVPFPVSWFPGPRDAMIRAFSRLSAPVIAVGMRPSASRRRRRAVDRRLWQCTACRRPAHNSNATLTLATNGLSSPQCWYAPLHHRRAKSSVPQAH